VKALFIPVTEAMKIVEIDESNALKPLQEYVGGLIEPVRITSDATGWANEEGLLIGLEYNSRASNITTQHIVGPLVVTGENMQTGDLASIPAWVLDLVEGE